MTSMSFTRVFGVSVAACVAIVIGACSSGSSPTNLGDCHDGVAGCACDAPGQTAACGTEISQTESTVTCSMGK
ncbi:MAG TPA: hypothetical protein VH054_05220, partial [Polyangiaceae bacterium]|nr:hypothetical protein [Polyangiaceae bacterium]